MLRLSRGSFQSKRTCTFSQNKHVFSHTSYVNFALKQDQERFSTFYVKLFNYMLIIELCFSLWPHMPREHYRTATPHVRALCDKWGIEYELKTAYQAFYDVFK